MDTAASMAGAVAGVALIGTLCLAFVLAPGLLANRMIGRTCTDVAVKYSSSDEGIVLFFKEILNSAADPVTWAVSLAFWGALGFLIWKLKSKPRRSGLSSGRLHAVLSKHGLLDYRRNFEDNNIDDALLPFLTDEQLQSLGIAKVGDRVRLLEEFSTT
jgi:hypothetical protein